MKHQYLTLLLTLLMSMVASVANAHDFEVDGIYYNITSSTGLTVCVTFKGERYNSYQEYSGSVTIPASVTFNNTLYRVTSINSSALNDCALLTSIALPSSLNDIGDAAFRNCIRLTEVTFYESPLADGTITLGNMAFDGCEKLSSITFSDNLNSIGDYAFRGCSSLTSITIPEGVIKLGSCVFYDCSALASIIIPETVTTIGFSAFFNTPWFNNQPDGLLYVNKIAYIYKGTMPENTQIEIKEGTIEIASYAFRNCIGLVSVIAPEGLTSIRRYAFDGCTNLTSINIPESVSTIEFHVFNGTEFYNNLPDGLNYLGNVAYVYKGTMPEDTKIALREGTLGIASHAFVRCSGLTSITIPESVIKVCDYAFCGCTGLTNVIIPKSVCKIEENAFSGCTNLTSLIIPSNVKRIEDYTFNECSRLSSIYIPDGVTSIGENAFASCSALPSITIPSSVTNFGVNAFYDCNNLISVTSLSTNPVPIKATIFHNRANATLYVPTGSKALYEVADYWSEFKTIQELVEPTEVEITVGSAGMATYCSPYDLDFTDSDAKAYVVCGFTPSTAQVILTRVYDVKAGTGIIVKAAEGNYTIPVREAETILVNMLKGITFPKVLNKEDGDYTNYILAKKNDVLGFYAVVDGSTLGANKAYLPLLTSALPAAAEVKLMLVFDDEELATGIEAPEKQEGAEGAIYNLNGQRMSRLHKGVNIVGGKKVFIK